MQSVVRVMPLVAVAFFLMPAILPSQVRVEIKRASKASRVLTTANRYVGTRYVFGGTTPRGFDCSGFVQYVFARHGVRLPRTSRQQSAAGRRVAAGLSGLRPGDLLLFASSGKRIDHIAIYVGGNRIIHSSASGGGVRYDNLKTKRGKWFARHHVASRRVLRDGAPVVADLTIATESWPGPIPGSEAPRPQAGARVTRGLR